jgi:hypothetical protein
LVIACRVSVEPAASLEIDCGGPLDSFPMSDSRVSSPKAAKTDARSWNSVGRLGRMLDMALNIRHLLGPTALIHSECFEPTVFGNCVKSRFREEKNGAAIFRFEPELDQGRGLDRVVV